MSRSTESGQLFLNHQLPFSSLIYLVHQKLVGKISHKMHGNLVPLILWHCTGLLVHWDWIGLRNTAKWKQLVFRAFPSTFICPFLISWWPFWITIQDSLPSYCILSALKTSQHYQCRISLRFSPFPKYSTTKIIPYLWLKNASFSKQLLSIISKLIQLKLFT